MSINKLAVFCGSHTGKCKNFEEETRSLAGILISNNIELIYGGGNRGLMGIIADEVMAGGGTVRGVIPQLLTQWESQHNGISELLIVEDMHIRKRKLYDLCDAALILPGGFGTMDELFEILTWNQLSIHNKKVFLMNISGFFNHLLAHMFHMEKEGFLYGSMAEKLTVLENANDFAECLHRQSI